MYVGDVDENIKWQETALPTCLRMSNGKLLTMLTPNLMRQFSEMSCSHLYPPCLDLGSSVAMVRLGSVPVRFHRFWQCSVPITEPATG